MHFYVRACVYVYQVYFKVNFNFIILEKTSKKGFYIETVYIIIRYSYYILIFVSLYLFHYVLITHIR